LAGTENIFSEQRWPGAAWSIHGIL
jgi:hypothetical protein